MHIPWKEKVTLGILYKIQEFLSGGGICYTCLMFDRSAPWEAFNAQFEIVSHVNGWTREERLHFLVQA